MVDMDTDTVVDMVDTAANSLLIFQYLLCKANRLTYLLKGGDLRSMEKADEIINNIYSQKDFYLLLPL